MMRGCISPIDRLETALEDRRMLREDRDSRLTAAAVDSPEAADFAIGSRHARSGHPDRNGGGTQVGTHGAVADTDIGVLALIADAVLTSDRATGERQLRDLLARGVSRHELIDDMIPRVARRFGEAWCLSGHSFAEVTIAVARLQGWLRELEPCDGTDPFRLDAPEILLVVPEGCQHTLGAMVALSRFRRLGALVRLSLGRDPRSIGMQVRAQHFDMIALSAAGNEDLDFLAGVINSIRSGMGSTPRIVLGGEILNQRPDAPILVGADFATSDPEEALRLCGLTISADAHAGRHPSREASRTRGQPSRAPDHV
jgi:hypothetical protein